MFDLAVMTLTFKILPGLYLLNRKVDRDIDRGCRCATSLCDLDFVFDLVVVTMSFKILSRAIFLCHKV